MTFVLIIQISLSVNAVTNLAWGGVEEKARNDHYNWDMEEVACCVHSHNPSINTNYNDVEERVWESKRAASTEIITMY